METGHGPVDGRPAGRHGSGGERRLLCEGIEVGFASICSRIEEWLTMDTIWAQYAGWDKCEGVAGYIRCTTWRCLQGVQGSSRRHGLAKLGGRNNAVRGPSCKAQFSRSVPERCEVAVRPCGAALCPSIRGQTSRLRHSYHHNLQSLAITIYMLTWLP